MKLTFQRLIACLAIFAAFFHIEALINGQTPSLLFETLNAFNFTYGMAVLTRQGAA